MGVIVGSGGTGSEGHSSVMSLPTGTSDPGSAAAGDMYYKTDTKKIRIYDGSSWDDLASGAAAAAYTSGSGSGLIFDCDFGRMGSYTDGQHVTGTPSLSSALIHNTTDWSSNSSNTPMTLNGGSFNYNTGNGGHINTYTNNCRISIGAGSGNPAFSDKLNTQYMAIEGWYMYNGSGRDVLVSRYGGGFPNQFNHIVDPGGQFHFNSSGVGCSAGDRDWNSFGDNVWFHCIWQYNAGTHQWYVNNSLKGSDTAGSSLATSSQTGFAIASRADDYERLEGKVAIVRIYNRALTTTEIAAHWNAEKGRFGL